MVESKSTLVQHLLVDDKLCSEFLEASPNSIVIIALDGEVLAYNNNALELFGYSLDSEAPLNVKRAYKDPDVHDELLAKLAKDKFVQDFETVLLAEDGREIHGSVNVSLFNLNGVDVHIATIRDISACKSAKAKLRKSEDNFYKLFEASSDTILIVERSGRVLDCNRRAESFFERPKDDLLDLNLFRLVSFAGEQDSDCNSELAVKIEEALRTGESFFFCLLDADGYDELHCSIKLKKIELDSDELLMCFVSDVSGQVKERDILQVDRIRFDTLSALYRMNGSSIKDVYDFTLEAAVRITQSKIGYVYFLSADEKILTLYAWSKDVMPACSVTDIPDSYHVSETGLWGEAVRQRKPFVTNDYSSFPTKRGLPEGHIPILRHMNVPLFENESIVLLVGVGNKEKNYTNEDVRQLTMLMEGMWNVVRRMEADEALRTAYSNLEHKVIGRTEELSAALNDLKIKNEEIEAEISQRRVAERELSISARRLALATRSGGVGVWEWFPEEGILLWDEIMRDLYQIDSGQSEVSYAIWKQLVHADDLEKTEQILTDAIERKELFNWEFRIVRNDGDFRYIKASALPVLDKKTGELQSMIGINQDITELRRLEQSIIRAERIISATPDLVSQINRDYHYVMVNDSYVKAFGKPREFFIGRHHKEIVGEYIFEKVTKKQIDAAFSGEIRTIESWFNIPHFGRRFLSITLQLIPSEGAGEDIVAVVGHDITAVKIAEEDRQHVFEVSLDMLFVSDLDGKFIELNPAWGSTLGWSEEKLKESKWLDFVHPEDVRDSVKLLESIQTSKVINNFENRYKCSDESWRWISWSLHCDIEQGKLTGVARDVTDQKRMVDDLKRMASTDVLTGANNRRSFMDRAAEEIDRFRRYGGSLTMLMLDIDHFKKINDSFGHDVGDAVLKELVNCSKEILRTSDIFGRIGGEEFAALLVQGDYESATTVAERLRLALGKLEVDTSGGVVRFTVSIGLASVESDTASLDEIMKRADRNLYKAKQNGRNQVVS